MEADTLLSTIGSDFESERELFLRVRCRRNPPVASAGYTVNTLNETCNVRARDVAQRNLVSKVSHISHSERGDANAIDL
jgi:hypothetical protein